MRICQATDDPTGPTTGQLISTLVQKFPSMAFNLPEDNLTSHLIVDMAKTKHKSNVRPPSGVAPGHTGRIL